MPVSIRPVLKLDYTLAAALATGVTTNVDYAATRPFVVSDVHNVATANAGVSGTSQILRQALGAGGFNAVSAALAMSASGTLTRAASITAAQMVVAATDVLRCAFVDGGGAGGANGRAFAELLPTPITGA